MQNSSKIQAFARELFDLYDSHKISEISSSRFTQAELLQWLNPFVEGNQLRKTVLGTSGEGRTISLYTIGKGPVSVMLWSQMHGDEPTATMALADMFAFFGVHSTHPVAQSILGGLTLLAVPMLNPDGAERGTRRSAQGIDINRDARALESPEAKILKTLRETHRPAYGFNLHDQEPRYTVGSTKNITAVALLAPATDEERSDSPVRTRAKKVAAIVAQVLEEFIPGHVAKWDDTYVPNAFGDSIQRWGTSTVLIESGGWRGDPDKFFIRKLNCVALLTTLAAIASGEAEQADTAVYERIPFNTKNGYDYILRNALYKPAERTSCARVDVGIVVTRKWNAPAGLREEIASIVDIGDLRAFAALECDQDANGAELDAARVVLDRPFPAGEIPLLLKRS